MLSTQQPILRRFWYPVMPATQLADGKPHAFTLLGEAIVLWQSAEGGVHCLKDRCCHRTAKLSLGFVEGDRIVCGYHGWTFEGGGACVRIPQLAADRAVPANYCVPAYRAALRYGYVWVALGEPLIDIPELPEAGRPGYRQVDQFYEVWKIGALRLMENSFDAAHIAYVHRGTFGNMRRPEVAAPEIEAHPYGLTMRVSSRVVVRDDEARHAVGAEGGETTRDMESVWFMPFVRRSRIRYPHGLEHVIITCATPIDDQQSMVVQWAYRNDTEADVSSADVIAFDREITLEDKLILESCEADVPLAVVDGEEMHMPTDRPGLAMRRALKALLEAHGETEQRLVRA
ncbi:aromatic ring-hydroxylating dioxygenase subunit alpha [uncultured Pseudacidovorax sp.]|uniref:aromatic ring-hydroxylating dioxygenase subunit alpha n=1 Tax=uncultured Pseudacidovorax sp. TaxID=679313 RepID=UPI0025DA1385|nr:aromatic ring-hydroxylating dioxygenase subunit alpha [uncultured Pseudacidovorax sp.]